MDRRRPRAVRAQPPPRHRAPHRRRRSTPRSTSWAGATRWPIDPRAAVSLLFELQGAANVTSSALDRVARRRARARPGADGRARAAGLGRWDPPGALDGDRLARPRPRHRRAGRRDRRRSWWPRRGDEEVAVVVPTAGARAPPDRGRRSAAGPGRGDAATRSPIGGAEPRRRRDGPPPSPSASSPWPTSWSGASRHDARAGPRARRSSASSSAGRSARSRPSATGWPRPWWPSRRPTPCSTRPGSTGRPPTAAMAKAAGRPRRPHRGPPLPAGAGRHRLHHRAPASTSTSGGSSCSTSCSAPPARSPERSARTCSATRQLPPLLPL